MKMNLQRTIPSLISVILAMQACKPAAPAQSATHQEETPVVETPILVPVSKGVIKSDNEVPVYSRMQGQLMEVKLLEGQKVRKGELLFRMDDSEIRASLELKESELEQCRVKMEEILIGQGYRRSELSSVPENIRQYASIKSGCNVCQKEIELYRAKLQRTSLTAPISGVVTTISASSYYFVDSGQTLCLIVDTDHLIVCFSVLETEISRFSVGTELRVSTLSYSNQYHKAHVRTVGSVVDSNGMVQIEAVLEDNENLMPGMTAIINS